MSPLEIFDVMVDSLHWVGLSHSSKLKNEFFEWPQWRISFRNIILTK
jgi:hypothetical protein